MSNQKFKAYDVKLKDGRYFKNVLVCSEFGAEDSKEIILDNQYTSENKEAVNIEMDLFHRDDDDDCDNALATIKSEDIEYICNVYKDREVI